MIYKVIYKNFKSNFKNYILFFACNMFAVTELFLFLGINDVILRSVTDATIAMTFKMDFMIATGLVTVIAIAMMVFSMKYYMKLRAKDYSFFIVIGMKKKTSYFLLLTEYLLGCIASFVIGLLLGNLALFGIQKILSDMNPGMIQISSVSGVIYRNICYLSFGIMAGVFIILLVWMDGKDLSMLMGKSEVKEKRPVSKIWLLVSLLGVGVIVFAIHEYERGNWGYIYSHVEWPVGMFIVLAFGGGIVLDWIKHRRKFYLRNVLRINQLDSRYQNNLLIIGMLLFIHFFALTYINVEVSSVLPITVPHENYPYDAVWMAQEKDSEYCEKLAEKYGGEVKELPMFRVTTYYEHQEIGVSETVYQKMTGKSLGLKGREIAVGVEDKQYQKEENVTTQDHDYEYLHVGKYSQEIEMFKMLPSKLETHKEYQYHVKQIFTQNVLGKYGQDDYNENVVVFSDEYFEEQYKKVAENREEPSVLNLFTFPEEHRQSAWKELKNHADKESVEVFQSDNPGISRISVCYGTDAFLQDQKMNTIFKVSSKLFILVSLFFSGIFIMAVKILSDLPFYQRKYEFLNVMGMRKRSKIKNLQSEIQNIFNIALGSGVVMAFIYVWTVADLCKKSGQNLNPGFWKYWSMIMLAYLMVYWLVQKIFVWYMSRRLEE